MHTSGGRERAGWPDVSEILDTCGDRSRLPDFHARVHSFVCYVRCRKEICVHVERAGWPDFRARVYINRKAGEEKDIFVDVERAGGPDCFMQVHILRFLGLR